MKHTDFLGNPVAVGDRVAFVTNNYRDLSLGRVCKLTPKGFQVEFVNRYGQPDKTYRVRDYVVKVAV